MPSRRARFDRLAHHLHVELARPVAGGEGRRLVPVVRGLVEHQQRALARHVADEAVRRVEQRRPPQEMRVGLVRRRVIVEEVVLRPAREDHQSVVAVRGQRGIGARPDRFQVGGKAWSSGTSMVFAPGLAGFGSRHLAEHRAPKHARSAAAPGTETRCCRQSQTVWVIPTRPRVLESHPACSADRRLVLGRAGC